ncbi:MAG: DUF350 domain-containing protein [Spirochaetes bacterium]|nr:DUF350 domain-containing protein [Spirochaetota bacterium]
MNYLMSILYSICETAIFSFVGIILMGIGFLLIKLFTPFSIKKEIEEDQNTSLAIIIGSIILGISIIVASVIMSPSSITRTPTPSTKVQSDLQK